MRSVEVIDVVRWLLAIGLIAGLSPPATAADRLDFNRDIRPILGNHCLHCHGIDEASRQGGVRLDLSAAAILPGESGAVPIVPGHPDSSALIERVFSTDDSVVMPPVDGGGKPLSEAQKQLLRRWVAEGARYDAHWAFVPPECPPVPAVSDATWPRNPIDAFVLADLEARGMKPSPEASRPVLIRRLALDLTGLPPTPAEVDDFLADPAPDAYEKVVDRLLASPHHGERMAQQWLDYARYGDSNGYDEDFSRQMTAWRDWVIGSFNDNMPFDQFTICQLAGDLLPTPTREQRIATGFNRNHRLNAEAGILPEEWRVETVIDRVETTGLTWLGLTVGCARCHDHKYDPITQREFYELFAFFNNVPESGIVDVDGKNTPPTLPLPDAAQEKELERLRERTAAVTGDRDAHAAAIDRLVAEWEPGFLEAALPWTPRWTAIEPTTVASSGGATFTPLPDGTWLAGGPNPAHDVYTLTAPAPEGRFTGLLLEVFPDPSLPQRSLGRHDHGNFVLTGVEAEFGITGVESPERIRFVAAEADHSQPGYEARFLCDDEPRNGWAVDGDVPANRVPRRLVLVGDLPMTLPGGATLTIRLRHDSITGHNIGRFRLSSTSMPRELIGLRMPAAAADSLRIVQTPVQARTAEEQRAVVEYFRREVDSPLRRSERAVETASSEEKAFVERLPTTMVMEELPEPRETFVLGRGLYDQPGEKVVAATPAALPPLPPGVRADRLALARWIVDPTNPLTSRVWVNRTWERCFGVGLTKTADNLGTQGEYPSHPALLDWLATEFVRQAWNMKGMQKLIVTSATYRQASAAPADSFLADPENRLLARGARFRLSGETIRDQALSLSGLLVRRVGGPSVRPYMPEGVWDETSLYGDLLDYRADEGEGLYRRTLYTIWKRTAAPPTLLLFDAPSRETCTISRQRTNTPLQALALLNEVTFFEAARVLAERMMREGGSTHEGRLDAGFRTVAGRPMLPGERQVLLNGVTADIERFRRDPAAAALVVAAGHSKPDPAFPLDELAAFTLVGNILLNLDEVITRE
jgi:hypothetical protein